MTKVNEFPVFTVLEMEDLRRKIIHGVLTEDFRAPHPAHVARASIEGKEWVKYPCWLGASKWNDGKGFFKLKFKGHTLYIHRASYECFNGPVPDGKLVDHLCRVRACRQPAHLEAISPKENILRGAQQAALIRGEVPCPISAKEINPEFFGERDRDAITQEYWRRLRESRNVKRYWEAEALGPPPPAPEGFKWEPSGSLGPITHFLNPIREEPNSHYDAVSAKRAEDRAHQAFADYVCAYEPRAQVAGVDYPDTSNDLPPPAEPPIAFNPAWLEGDSSAKMLIRDVPPFASPSADQTVHVNLDKIASSEQPYEFGPPIVINPTPVEPDWEMYSIEFKKIGWWRSKWRALKAWLDAPIGS